MQVYKVAVLGVFQDSSLLDGCAAFVRMSLSKSNWRGSNGAGLKPQEFESVQTGEPLKTT